MIAKSEDAFADAVSLLFAPRLAKLFRIGPWRFLDRAIARSLSVPRYRDVTLFFGVPMTVVLPEVISEQLYTYGLFDETVTWLVLETVREGDVVLDVGAHFGYFTLLFAHLAGSGGHVFAFEPTPSTFAVLEKNTRSAPNVTVVNKALGRDAGQLSISDYGLQFSAWNTLSGQARTATAPAQARLVAVDVIRMDDWIEEHCVQPDVIKIDAENFESEVVAGLAHTIERKPPRAIILETGSQSSLQAGNFLLANGYHVRVSNGPGHLGDWSGSLESANDRYKDVLFVR